MQLQWLYLTYCLSHCAPLLVIFLQSKIARIDFFSALRTSLNVSLSSHISIFAYQFVKIEAKYECWPIRKQCFKIRFHFLCTDLTRKKVFCIWLFFNGILNEFSWADLFSFVVMENYWKEYNFCCTQEDSACKILTFLWRQHYKCIRLFNGRLHFESWETMDK